MKWKVNFENFIFATSSQKSSHAFRALVHHALIAAITLGIFAVVFSCSTVWVRAGDIVPDVQPVEAADDENLDVEEPADNEVESPEISTMQEEFLDAGDEDGDDDSSEDETLGSVSNDGESVDAGVSDGAGASATPFEHKGDIDENTLESTLTIEAAEPNTPNGETADDTEIVREEAPEEELVDAPAIEPEGSEGEYNIFGAAGAYYVSVPKSMSFKKLSDGSFETSESSYYTVNSVLDNTYSLSVKVSGINTDDTVELTNESGTVYRKVEVSTAACDIWQYRPDGTVLTVNGSDNSGYGEELILEGPGKFKAKCKLSQFGDDVIHAGTWKGSILFTVTCSPDPGTNGEEAQDAGIVTEGDDTATTDGAAKTTPQPADAQPAAEPEELTPEAQEQDTLNGEEPEPKSSDEVIEDPSELYDDPSYEDEEEYEEEYEEEEDEDYYEDDY